MFDSPRRLPYNLWLQLDETTQSYLQMTTIGFKPLISIERRYLDCEAQGQQKLLSWKVLIASFFDGEASEVEFGFEVLFGFGNENSFWRCCYKCTPSRQTIWQLNSVALMKSLKIEGAVSLEDSFLAIYRSTEQFSCTSAHKTSIPRLNNDPRVFLGPSGEVTVKKDTGITMGETSSNTWIC